MSKVLPILFNTEMVRAILDDRKTATRRIIKFPVNKYTDEIPKAESIKVYENTLRSESIHFHEEPFYCFDIRPPYNCGDVLYVRETWNYGYIETSDAQGISEEWFGQLNPSDKHGSYIKALSCYFYKADEDAPGSDIGMVWRPSIHMPKEAARIWLKVTDVRVERLRDINEEQAIREGIIRLYDDLPDAEYIDWTKRTGVFPKGKEEWGYKNYLWHGNFGSCGTGNKMSDAWEYQYSSYDSAIDSFSSLWNSTVPLKEWDTYGWDASPWVWVNEFERCEKPEGWCV